MFDSDAYNKGLEFAWKFISWGLSASVIRLVGTEDPSNIGEDECKKRINSVGELDFETYIKQYLEV